MAVVNTSAYSNIGTIMVDKSFRIQGQWSLSACPKRPTQFELASKSLPRTNTLAYFDSPPVAKKKVLQL
jgi:hypothetical protein